MRQIWSITCKYVRSSLGDGAILGGGRRPARGLGPESFSAQWSVSHFESGLCAVNQMVVRSSSMNKMLGVAFSRPRAKANHEQPKTRIWSAAPVHLEQRALSRVVPATNEPALPKD